MNQSKPGNMEQTNDTNYSSFITKIKDWLEINTPVKISIATVCPSGSCDTAYVACLIETISLLQECRIPFSVAFANGDPLLGRARNELVNEVLTDPNITHVVFINPDIVWNSIDIIKLILSDKDVIGGVAPFKKYHFKELLDSTSESWIRSKNNSAIKDFVSDVDVIQHKLLKYKSIIHSQSEVVIKENVLKVKFISSGFLLVRRAVFHRLFDIYNHTKYCRDHDAEENTTQTNDDNLYAIFDSECRNNKYIGPDETFCARFTAIGGEIFADVSIELGHVGKETFKGNFLSSLIV